MKNEVLLWLAGELGLSVDADSVGKHKRVRFVYDGMWVRFDLEGDMPINAWLREKVVEWLGVNHRIFFDHVTRAWQACRWVRLALNEDKSEFEDSGLTIKESRKHTLPQSIIAAVQWVYENREEK